MNTISKAVYSFVDLISQSQYIFPVIRIRFQFDVTQTEIDYYC